MSGAVDKRILFISSAGCGPPYHGNRARVKTLLAEIKAQGYEIHFAGVWMTPEEKAATMPHVDRWVADFEYGAPLDIPARIKRKLSHWAQRFGPLKRIIRAKEEFALDRWFQSGWRKKVRELQAENNYHRVLVAYVFHSAFFNVLPKGCLKILDCHDVFANRHERMKKLGLDLKDYWFSISEADERKGVMRADVILGIQDQESEYFRKVTHGRRTVRTVGHFVDAEELPFSAKAGPLIGYLASENPLNVSGMQWFLKEVWPEVQKRMPEARLQVGGRICKAIEWSEGIEVLGELDEIKSLYASSLVTVNPMLGGTGLKIKTVESLAFGRAVISTNVGADGLDSYRGRGLYVAADAAEFIEGLLNWLKDPALAQSQGKEAVHAMEEFNLLSKEQLRLALAEKN